MWRWMVMLGILYCSEGEAQKKWDGGAGTSDWNNELNWFPDGVPVSNDDVVLDNTLLTGSYTVDLPSGSTTIYVKTLTIQPAAGTIILSLPSSNNANPGFSVTGTGDALVISAGGVFRNASGATAGSGVLASGIIRINDGGKYLHQTPRSNAGIIDKLSTADGTGRGIFEFDVPGTAGYTVSLTGNNFGSLSFSATASGGTKSYSGSGVGTLLVRGDLSVYGNAQLTSTLSADIVIGGSLSVDGKLNLNPSTSGTVSRSLRFIGSDAHLKGTGAISMNASFRNVEVAKGSRLSIEKPLTLSQAQHAFVCRGTVILNTQYIDGAGSFLLLDSATLHTADVAGILSTGEAGAVRTAIRSFGTRANYVFDGPYSQATGDAVPDTISSLGVNNGAMLALTHPVYVRDSLRLTKGKILTTPTSLLTLGTNQIRSPANKYGAINQGWEIGFVEGPIGLHTHTGTPFVAPLGSGEIFAPLEMTLVEPGEQIVVLKYNPYPLNNVQLGNDLKQISTNEHWQFLAAPLSRYLYAASFRPTSLVVDSNQALTIAAIASGSNSWKAISSENPGGSHGWLTADTPASNINVIAIGARSGLTVLPIRIMSFSGQQDGERILLNWFAEEEGKDISYLLERSSDGRNFLPLATINSGHRPLERHHFSDVVPLPINYYRLYMAQTGRGVWSKTIRIKYEEKKVKIYPNPATDQITINFPRSRSKYEVEIVSLTGTVCKKFVCNTATCQIRVNDLRRGVYFMRLTDSFGSITLQLTKN